MKAIIISTLLLLNTIGFSQETTYKNGILKLKSGNYEKNIGRNVKVKYDSFFDNYKVSYDNKNGLKVNMSFKSSIEKPGTYTYNNDNFIVIMPETIEMYGFITFSGGPQKTYSITELIK